MEGGKEKIKENLDGCNITFKMKQSTNLVVFPGNRVPPVPDLL